MSALKSLWRLPSSVLCCLLAPSAPRWRRDESARAIFDAENDQVILPLDAYDTTGKDEYFTKALGSPAKKCFAEHGQHYKMFVRTEDPAGTWAGPTESGTLSTPKIRPPQERRLEYAGPVFPCTLIRPREGCQHRMLSARQR